MPKSTFADRLETIRERIALAAQRAGRDAADVTLVAVSKTFPLDAIREARACGVRDFGENRALEFAEKAETLAREESSAEPVRWHFIGHLQRNKAAEVARHADLFHALDSARLAKALEKAAAKDEAVRARPLPCLIQVNISGEPQKYGLEPAELPGLLDTLAGLKHVAPAGVMGMAAYGAPPDALRRQFATLRRLFDAHAPSPAWRACSMGMSGDFETAIEEGATHVRIGSALFGARD